MKPRARGAATTALQNFEIANIFNEIADLLELQNGNPFRIRAYRNAARVLSDLGSEVSELVRRGYDLTNLPGIGQDLSEKIKEIVSTEKCSLLCDLQSKLPRSLRELLKIPGLGPKRVQRLYNELNIKSVSSLIKAAKEGRLRNLPHFGEKLEKKVLKSAETLTKSGNRTKLFTASQCADNLIEAIRSIKGVSKAEAAGSLRRSKETVGDIDIVVLADPGCDFIHRLSEVTALDRIVSSGKERATVVLKSGMQVDFRLATNDTFGSMMLYFTGSKEHSIALRTIAQERGLKLNEYGLFKNGRRVAGKTENSIYSYLGFEFIAPELRENCGEIDAAQEKRLPSLICPSDLRGDLHCHSTETDGRNTILEMVLAAKKRGYEYIAITDHSAHLTIARGLNEERIKKQIALIDDLNRKVTGIRILKGTEVDILENGRLDFSDDILNQLDVVIASVHSKFNLSREEQTKRILRAMENSCMNVLGHPTGRLIDRRPPYEIDLPCLIKEARKYQVALELNSQPERMDLQDTYCRLAKDSGVLLCINTDAHSIEELDFIRFGTGQARRAWLEKDDVLNSRSLPRLLKALRSKRQYAALTAE